MKKIDEQFEALRRNLADKLKNNFVSNSVYTLLSSSKLSIRLYYSDYAATYLLLHLGCQPQENLSNFENNDRHKIVDRRRVCGHYLPLNQRNVLTLRKDC